MTIAKGNKRLPVTLNNPDGVITLVLMTPLILFIRVGDRDDGSKIRVIDLCIRLINLFIRSNWN
ncbi:hypothetical protein FQS88_10800 [Enterococcus casseliflavus]|nr:hypothetical protein [Enterococcus casseliflavus]